MSTHFTIFHIVSYYIGLLLTICSYLIIVHCILYYELVSLPQYYDYCVQLYIHYILLIVFILVFIKLICSLDFAFAAKFLLVWHVINITFCSV